MIELEVGVGAALGTSALISLPHSSFHMMGYESVDSAQPDTELLDHCRRRGQSPCRAVEGCPLLCGHHATAPDQPTRHSRALSRPVPARLNAHTAARTRRSHFGTLNSTCATAPTYRSARTAPYSTRPLRHANGSDINVSQRPDFPAPHRQSLLGRTRRTRQASVSPDLQCSTDQGSGRRRARSSNSIWAATRNTDDDDGSPL